MAQPRKSQRLLSKDIRNLYLNRTKFEGTFISHQSLGAKNFSLIRVESSIPSLKKIIDKDCGDQVWKGLTFQDGKYTIWASNIGGRVQFGRVQKFKIVRVDWGRGSNFAFILNLKLKVIK